jgi:hypothetical protein
MPERAERRGQAMKPLKMLLFLAAIPLLTGCVPMMALSAANMVAQGAQGSPASNEALQPQARDACTQQASRYGAVHVIDTEQNRIDRIIVWGTVDDGKQKRSFECDYGTKITGFRLREIHPQE